MLKRSYKAVFFDLDGTLLPIDMDAFLKNYFNDIAAFVQARGHDPKQFIDALSAGVKSMLTKQGGLNSERFWETFTSRMGGDSSAEYEKMMDEYYATRFDGLSAMATNVDPNAAYVVKTLKEKGYPLYLTTMPLSPTLRLKSAFLGRMSPQAHSIALPRTTIPRAPNLIRLISGKTWRRSAWHPRTSLWWETIPEKT